MEWYEKKRGRPKGSKTKAATPGRKRAREFFDMRFETVASPTSCAMAIADKFNTEPYQVFKDAARHEQSVAADVWQEAEQAKAELEKSFAQAYPGESFDEFISRFDSEIEEVESILVMGPHLPKDTKIIRRWTSRNASKGYLI